jgi:hypothetical protein
MACRAGLARSVCPTLAGSGVLVVREYCNATLHLALASWGPGPLQVVFSEGWWVGTAEENPKEKKLPEPDWLAQPALHQKYDFSGRGTCRLYCMPGSG